MEKYFLIDTTPPQSPQEQSEALKHVALEVAETCNRLRCDAIRIVEGCTLIRKGRKCGIINKEGRVVVPIGMHVIIPPVNSQGKLFCTKDCQGRWGVVDENGKIVLVDYKTDFVKEQEELIAKYKEQLKLYKKAIEEALDKNVDEVYIYSTYLNKEIRV